MLPPKYQRFANRLRELIEEGKQVAKLPKPSRNGSEVYIQKEDRVVLQSWLTKVGSILEMIFGPQSLQVRHLKEVMPNGPRLVEDDDDIFPIIGVLNGALDDLEKGYLTGREFVIAGEIFDSVLEQAKHLNESGYKDPAAVLVRVVIEDALRRISRTEEGVDDTLNATRLNDELRRVQRYPQPQWRLVQSWLDIGNAAAHGKFSEYSKDDVKGLIEDVERFLAAELRP
jgi:hypothetical protein